MLTPRFRGEPVRLHCDQQQKRNEENNCDNCERQSDPLSVCAASWSITLAGEGYYHPTENGPYKSLMSDVVRITALA